MREKAVTFGKSASLIGIVAEPAPGVDSSGKPAVILLNSGILHRVGSCRLHVRLARALAPAGFTVLRFDYSGIGDSEPRRDQLSFEDSACLETREAMDYLATTKGTTSFVLMGLCSGADMAHQVARVDERVVGLVMLDAWAYRTPGFYLRYYGSRVGKWSVWSNFLRVRLRRLLTRASRPAAAAAASGVEYEVPKYVRVFPPRARVESELRSFARRGMDLFFIFSGGQQEHYNYRAQHEEAFRSIDFGGRLRVEYLPDADHIFTGLQHQALVVREARAWMERVAERIGPRAAPAPAKAPAAALTSAPPMATTVK
jgi:pimeloyl-ACP methyl ester carboxylesterase